MTSDVTRAEASTRPGTARWAAGAFSLAAGLVVFVSIVVQITDRVVNNAFDPAEYFSYFTIQSCLINIVVLTVGGVMAFRRDSDTVLYTMMRMSVVAYAVVTAGVYNALLRNIPYEGFQGVQWPNEVIHVWIPIYIALDWLLASGRPALGWTGLRVVIIYPLAWLAYTMVRGAITAYYPYPFLEPATGWVSVGAYIVGISAFIIGIAALAIAYGRWRAGRRVGALTPSAKAL